AGQRVLDDPQLAPAAVLRVVHEGLQGRDGIVGDAEIRQLRQARDRLEGGERVADDVEAVQGDQVLEACQGRQSVAPQAQATQLSPLSSRESTRSRGRAARGVRSTRAFPESCTVCRPGKLASGATLDSALSLASSTSSRPSPARAERSVSPCPPRWRRRNPTRSSRACRSALVSFAVSPQPDGWSR